MFFLKTIVVALEILYKVFSCVLLYYVFFHRSIQFCVFFSINLTVFLDNSSSFSSTCVPFSLSFFSPHFICFHSLPLSFLPFPLLPV